jgi:integrase
MGFKIKLTKTTVDAASSEGFYWDTELRGFGLRISGKTKSYIVQARISGKEVRRTVGRHGVYTAEEARKRARETLLQMSQGQDPKEEERARKAESTTLGELFSVYIDRKPLRARTLADYRSYMSRYFQDWHRIAIKDIKPDMVGSRHLYIGEHHGEAQADVAMRFLRALFNFAQGFYTRVDGEPLVSVNPTKRLNALRQWYRPNARETYIREHELGKWFSAVQQTRATGSPSAVAVCDYLTFLLFTGLRRTEASLIRWEHVDLDNRQVLLPKENTKNGTDFAIPLTSMTLDLLKKRAAERTSDLVFAGKGRSGQIGEPRYVMRKVSALSTVTFRLHDLRRTYATCASHVIDNQWTVKRLMNHLTGQDITQRYIQGVERLRTPAQLVTDFILARIAESPSN